MKMACVGLMFALVSSTASAAVVLRAADAHPPDYPTAQAVMFMGLLLEQRSDKRYRIQLFSSRQLGEENETIEQTRSGAIDINRVNLAPFNDVIPDSIALTLPFLFSSVEHMHRVLDSDIGDGVLKAFERHGLVGLAFYDSGTRSFYTRFKPIRTLQDFKGQKIRVQQSRLFLDLVTALGAQGVVLPYGQVKTALETGLVDGAENNWPSYESSEHYRVARYYTLTEHAMSPEVLLMSKVRWDKLSLADRALIRSSARESAVHMRELWRAREEEARKKVIDAGVTVITLPAEEKRNLAEKARAIYNRHVKDARLRALAEGIRHMAR